MSSDKAYHFVIDWRSSASLKQLLDELYQEEGRFIDISFHPPLRGEYPEPAKLSFDLHASSNRTGRLIGYVEYEAVQEDKATGIAYPADLSDQEV